MADTKISALSELAEVPANGDLIPVVDISDITMSASGTNKKVTRANLVSGLFVKASDDLDDITTGVTNVHFTATDETKLDGIEALADVTDAGNVGSTIHGATGKTTPVDADTTALIDSAASNVLKKVTWANIKATLKTYFDTLYNNYTHPNHSGDVTSTGDGATSIATGVIVNADINANAAIDATKIADGTVTSAEFQYIGGLTSDAQTQLNNKQPLDSDLTTLANAFTTASASGAASLDFAEDTDSGSNKITLKGAASVSSDKTITLPDETGTVLTSASGQPLDATLTALAAHNTNGLLTQTTTDTFTGRTITGTSNEITVSNGDGVSGNPTLSLPSTIDLGGKTSLEIPNSATPTVDADGEIAVDTTVTDWSHGILKYYSGEEMGVVAMPIAQFSAPSGDYVVKYNATADEFQLAADQTAAGGEVSDGDKGDIVVSSTGTVWTIDTGVVTYAKMQDVSATDRLLGRDTAAAGDVEELTVGGGVEFTGTGGIQRSALTGDVTASAGSNTTAIGAGVIVNADINANAAIDATKIADGSVTSTEFQYINTVTSNVQTQLDNKQPLDADLTTLSTAFSSASASGPASLAFHEDTDNGTNKVTIIAPSSVASDKTATLQDVTGTIYVTGGTDVSVADGGTGASTLTGLLQGNGTSAITGITNSSTVGQVLRVTGASTYAWGALDLADTDAVTGTLPNTNLPAATTTASGISELAIASELNTGTDATRAVTPDSLAGSNLGIRYVSVSLNGATALTTSDKAYLRIPAGLTGMNLVSVTGAVGTGAAGSSSSGTPTFTVKNVTDNQQMLSTNLTIDANEYTSATAATAAVINTSFDDVATDDLIEIACTTAGTGTTYATITLGFQLP